MNEYYIITIKIFEGSNIMNWYYNLKISKKLILGFVIVALFSGIVGLIGIINLMNLSEMDNSLYKYETLPLGDLSDMTYNFNIIRTKLRDIILDADMETKNLIKKQY